MHDQVLVGVLDGVADVEEELQPLAHAELLTIAIAIERFAVHVLHHEVGIAFLGFAGVEQARDVRVVQAGEDLPLGAEAQTELALHRAAVDDLDCDLRGVLTIGALAEVHGAGAAVAEYRYELVVADDAADERFAAIASGRIEGSTECKRERAGAGTAAVVARQELEQLGAQLRVVAGFFVDERLALGCAQLHGAGKQLLQPFPAIVGAPPCAVRAHDASGSRLRSGRISFSIQALARRISRSTVASETFKVSESSWYVRPPK